MSTTPTSGCTSSISPSCNNISAATTAAIATTNANEENKPPPQAPQSTLRITAPQEKPGTSEAISPSLEGAKKEIRDTTNAFKLLSTNQIKNSDQKSLVPKADAQNPKEPSERGAPGEELTVAARIFEATDGGDL